MTNDAILLQLLDECRRDHDAWINGDGSRYGFPDDGTILGAVGGHSRSGAETSQRQNAVAAQWRRGRSSTREGSCNSPGSQHRPMNAADPVPQTTESAFCARR